MSEVWKVRPYDAAYGAHPRVQAADCASYFGNGYTTDLSFIPSPQELGHFDTLHQSIASQQTAGSWVMCHHNSPVTTTVCDFGMVRINPEQIVLSRGGEPMQSVLGRSEDAEFPRYRPGALQVFSDSTVRMPFSIDPAHVHNLNYDLLKAIERSPSPLDCPEVRAWLYSPPLIPAHTRQHTALPSARINSECMQHQVDELLVLLRILLCYFCHERSGGRLFVPRRS